MKLFSKAPTQISVTTTKERFLLLFGIVLFFPTVISTFWIKGPDQQTIDTTLFWVNTISPLIISFLIIDLIKKDFLAIFAMNIIIFLSLSCFALFFWTAQGYFSGAEMFKAATFYISFSCLVVLSYMQAIIPLFIFGINRSVD